MNKKRVYHFHNGSGGGVLSVIKNLLKYSNNPAIENHVIYTINKEQTPTFFIPGLEGAASEQVFYYSPKWNFYYTCKKLAKLLPNDKAIIVAHDWLELGMVSNLGLQNPVVQFIHGDYEYYYNLARLHSSSISIFISVSSVIEKKLKSIIPKSENSIRYKRYPVCNMAKGKLELPSYISCAFFVKDLRDKNKGFSLLPLIDDLLVKDNIRIQWNIAGGGMTNIEFNNFWGCQEARIKFWGELEYNKIIDFLSKNNIMILPSSSEGFPVSVVEAMKMGLVPIVNYWDGATDELIIHNNTGYVIKDNEIEEYAKVIKNLYLNPQTLNQISIHSQSLANKLFDPILNTNDLNQHILESARYYNSRVPNRVYGSRLDRVFIPNFITYLLRKYITRVNDN